MTEINLDIYENEIEISSFNPNGTELLLRFSESIDGTVSLDDKIYSLMGGRCYLNLSCCKNGVISLKLNLPNRKLVLPTLIKDGNFISPEPYDDEFIRRLSKRTRILEKRVCALEEEVSTLKKSVYGATLFN